MTLGWAWWRVALGDIHLCLAWQAWYLCHFGTHNSWTHHLSHTPLCHTPSLSHTIFYTQLCHTTTWSHTIFPTHLCLTPSFTHIFVTHHLCHTPSFTHSFANATLFHTHTNLHIQVFQWSILHHLLCLSFLSHPTWTFVSAYWKNLTCGVIWSFNSSLIWPPGSAPAALASLLFDPPEPQIIGKTQWIATFLPFRAPASSLFFASPLWLFPTLLFQLSILSEVWLLNFLRWYDMIYDIWYMIIDIWLLIYDIWYMIYIYILIYYIWYMIYDKWYMICDIWCVIYDIYIYIYWYMIYDIWYMIYDIWYVIYDMWYMICDMWYTIYIDIWYMIYDIWYMIYDIWYMIYDIIWYVYYDAWEYIMKISYGYISWDFRQTMNNSHL